jgi:hypothetical protein
MYALDSASAKAKTIILGESKPMGGHNLSPPPIEIGLTTLPALPLITPMFDHILEQMSMKLQLRLFKYLQSTWSDNSKHIDSE